MTVSAHLEALHKKHDELKEQVKNAYAHHVPDSQLIRLKKMKLRLKDEIEIWSHKASNENTPQET